jgi:hypothetical protein
VDESADVPKGSRLRPPPMIDRNRVDLFREFVERGHRRNLLKTVPTSSAWVRSAHNMKFPPAAIAKMIPKKSKTPLSVM